MQGCNVGLKVQMRLWLFLLTLQTVYHDTANRAAPALFLTREAEHTLADGGSQVSAADGLLSPQRGPAFASTSVVWCYILLDPWGVSAPLSLTRCSSAAFHYGGWRSSNCLESFGGLKDFDVLWSGVTVLFYKWQLCMFVCVCLSVMYIYMHVYMYIQVYMSVCIYVYTYSHLSIYLSIWLSICLSIYSTTYNTASISVHLNSELPLWYVKERQHSVSNKWQHVWW